MGEALQIGDRVAFSRKFCQSTGQLTGDTPHARGRIAGLRHDIATIDWEPGVDLSPKTHIANLVRVTDARGVEEPV